MKGKMDAVVISTPDHNHFAVAMSAIKHGYDLYLEKPLCFSIWQCRELARAAKAAGVKTQMGNFVHSGDGVRTVKEWIAAGLIGEVKEVVMWTCRPLKGVNQRPGGFTSWPTPDPIPANFDWDKWQNISTPTVSFTKRVVPLNWRRFWKFGSGSLGESDCDTESLVFIHDGARPLVGAENISRLSDAAKSDGAAVLAARVSDTIKKSPPT